MLVNHAKLELECENEEIIINSFIERYEVSYKEAEDIFHETKKWLWLANKCQEKDRNDKLFIDKPLMIIDEMWHIFILHTKQYFEFCLKNFKKYIHHTPTPKNSGFKNKTDSNINYQSLKNTHLNNIKKQYSLIYDNLGADTLVKWYENLPTKYSPEYISSIKKN